MINVPGKPKLGTKATNVPSTLDTYMISRAKVAKEQNAHVNEKNPLNDIMNRLIQS